MTGGDTYHYTTEDTYIIMYVFVRTVKSCNRKQEYKQLHILSETVTLYEGIGGSVVEFSPATRVTRVRFPADARFDAFGLVWMRFGCVFPVIIGNECETK